MTRTLTLAFVIVIFSCFKIQLASAQPPPALKLNDSTLFDFWLGDWNAHWFEKDSVKALGENHLKKEMKGFVIEENFKINTGNSAGFVGSSWSVYDNNKKKWFQTWVDNSGAYMAFEAKLDGDKRIFERSTINKKGMPVVQRMVFKNIQKDSFTWDWETSSDNGKTWSLNWQIFYTRMK
jgi:hypothetical protein